MTQKANDKIITSGKRKTAVARAILTDGSGKVSLNNKNYESLQLFDKLKIEEPIRIAEELLGKDNMKFDVAIKIKSGGEKSQVEAARLALARAIIQFTKSKAETKHFSKEKPKELKEAYLKYDRNLLVADVRQKEAYKPGDSKARSKRQTSYR
ncbi:30S ribosomal protein S9 [Candidatus Pacearchaeota archaeon]|nr:30S ribosomal protein S9 [Candidatus Pacearchaeota archaeon]MBI2057200.1 30S ribosomal protein S9 [Candidatus Pacearchaeota archaeon]